MPEAAGNGVADWLALHGLDAPTCLSLLGAPTTAPAVRPPDPPLGSVLPLPFVLQGLTTALPRISPLLDRIRQEVQIDLSPDKTRFPRAFTLHDNGQGRPFMSCPVTGSFSDILMVAHELGHVCQIMMAEGRFIPPVQREAAAFLAEELVISATTDNFLKTSLRALHSAHSDRIKARHGTALRTALSDPTRPYGYGWNYPIARDLAARAARSEQMELVWHILRGSLSVPDLIDQAFI